MVTQLCRVIRPMRAASEGMDADESRRVAERETRQSAFYWQ